MSNTRIQALLPEATIKKFERLAKQQNRSKSNLAKKYIIEGILKDEENERTRK